MKKKEYYDIRVIPQFTIVQSQISLIAEETKGDFKKGDLVKRIQRAQVHEMERPLICRVTPGAKAGVKPTVKPVMK